MKKLPGYSLAEYEKSRPANEQKVKVEGFIVRAYVDKDGTLNVLAHRTSNDGAEFLPLGYLLGSNALMLKK